ncbi:MAG: acetyl-CoA C-acyltransferase, partial [Novosphingobium sp.]|nr:acetyl-CoA C-acyltransferase [Novosphingobium sp.]
MAEAYIIDAVRTPRGVGKPGKGALSHLHPQHLAATVLKALKERNNLDTTTVDDVIWSTSTQKGKQGGDLGRMAALAAGYDTSASGMTLDRFCGGGITSVNLATAAVMSGMEDCVIAGGTEMMSYTSALGAEEANAGIRPMGMGSGNPALDALHPQSHQGVCGDAIAAMEGIDRHALDALALVSQERAARAIKEGRFDKSLVTVYNDDGSVALDHEEFPRPETTAEGLASLKASFDGIADFDLGGTTFRKQIQRRYPDLDWKGVHHAGNSSGVVDGAGAVLITSKDY